MANIKKCDRCGKTYHWDYKATHAVVMVYDDEKHLHHTDLCPECDKAAAEWMNKTADAKMPVDEVDFIFESRSDAAAFMQLVRMYADIHDSVSLTFANGLRSFINPCITVSLGDQKDDCGRGWYKSSIAKMTLKREAWGYVVTIPGLVEFY